LACGGEIGLQGRAECTYHRSRSGKLEPSFVRQNLSHFTDWSLPPESPQVCATVAVTVRKFNLHSARSIDPFATIIVSEPATLRRRISRAHGATYALNPTPVNVPEAVFQITGGIGVDIAFDAAGVQTSIDTAVASVRPRGTAVNVAIWGESPQVAMNPLVLKEITLIGIVRFLFCRQCQGLIFFAIGSIAYDGIHSEVLIAVAARKIAGIEGLITSRIGIEDIVEKGFKALLNDKDSQGKQF
jgi:threonine dehydrogenase-like Zn-dependent dehydrogenase